MNKPARQLEWAVWGGLVLVILAIAVAFVASRMRGAGPMTLPVISQLPDFHLTNQNGQAVSLADLRGKVWVADVFFTQCPGPCATMSRKFAGLQKELSAEKSAGLLSLTSDPDHDTPAELLKYGARFGADTNRWWFFTGDKPQLRALEVHDFKFVVVETKPQDRTVPEDLFIHSTYFVIVDQKGQVRGWTDPQGQLHATFESDDPDALAKIVPAVKQLLRETP